MSEPSAEAVEPAIPAATLATVVRRALGRPGARLGRWSAAPLSHRVINRVTAGLWRVTGQASDGAATVAWSLVIKELHRPPDVPGSVFNAGDSPEHWNYWRREALLFDSGLLADLPAGLAAPRCYLVEEGAAESIRLWLEDVGGDPATAWPPARFEAVGRHLGQLQGAIAAGARPLPEAAWLSRGWLRAWIPDARAADHRLSRDPAAWRHPLLRGALPPDAPARLAALWAAREGLLVAVERTPRTLCHLDLWPRNIFGRRGRPPGDETVLIDWSQVGAGALGEDVANLVLDGVWMRCLDGADLPALEHAALTGYEAGLREGGWTGDVAAVRRLYASVGALRFGLLVGTLLEMAHDTAAYPKLERRYGSPAEETIRARALVVGHALALADEALAPSPTSL